MEPGFRAAIGHGQRLQKIEPDSQAHQQWLGDVHLEFAKRLAAAGRDKDGGDERALAKEVCRAALKLSKDDAKRDVAQTCIDDANAGPTP